MTNDVHKHKNHAHEAVSTRTTEMRLLSKTTMTNDFLSTRTMAHESGKYKTNDK